MRRPKSFPDRRHSFSFRARVLVKRRRSFPVRRYLSPSRRYLFPAGQWSPRINKLRTCLTEILISMTEILISVAEISIEKTPPVIAKSETVISTTDTIMSRPHIIIDISCRRENLRRGLFPIANPHQPRGKCRPSAGTADGWNSSWAGNQIVFGEPNRGIMRCSSNRIAGMANLIQKSVSESANSLFVKIHICADYDEMSEEAARSVAEAIRAKPKLVLCVPSGNTPRGMYQELIRMRRQNQLDFSKVKFFLLDEYLGLRPGHPQS